MDPLVTVTSLLMEALGKDRGSPRAWFGPVREALDPADRALFGPLLGADGNRFIPDSFVPESDSFAPRFCDRLEQVASTSADELAADIARDGQLDSAWGPVARRPQRWLAAYTSCLQKAWTTVEPLWDRARPLLEREVDRVGSALARGSFDVLLDGLSQRFQVVDDVVHLENHEHPVVVAPYVVLCPIVGGSRALFANVRDGAVHDLSYPLPGSHRLRGFDDVVTADDPLTALVGEPRAALLRRLNRTMTAGDLAESMLYVPSSISHHLLALERAGLIQRERSGRHVLVSLTARGTALMNLYDG